MTRHILARAACTAPAAVALGLIACSPDDPATNAGTGETSIEMPVENSSALPANAAVQPPAPGPTDAPLDVDYVGRWDAADGGYLVVVDNPGGGMTLEFHSQGRERRIQGSVTAEGLRFMRDDHAESAVMLTGSTGTCLNISDSEEYCRK